MTWLVREYTKMPVTGVTAPFRDGPNPSRAILTANARRRPRRPDQGTALPEA
jgi:hypothetical protein